MKGYTGKILWVDLAQKKFREEKLDENIYRDFLGGYGIGAKILLDHQKAYVDPLSPCNILGFMTGLFTGTQALGGSRYVVVGKSPLTGTWGDANSGGEFGPNLKFSGFDGVFFTGISQKPVYLFINNGRYELKNAAHLWGKDTFETEDILKAQLGHETEIACIGPSGENLSLIAAVMNNKGRAAARSGLGAVMGSKRLKAVAVKGNINIPIYDNLKVTELRKKYIPQLGGPVKVFRDFGTPFMTEGANNSGDSPVKNWDGIGTIDFPGVEKIGGNAVIERQEKKYACWRCVIGCGGHMKEGNGEYKYAAGAHKPEYETLSMFGSNCLNNNLESIIKINDICNRNGLDTISAGATIAMAIDAYEHGIITKEDTDGVELTWGNHASMVTMVEKMAQREGFGAILADGTSMASARIGNGADKFAMHIGRQEFAAHDPKLNLSFATGYRMDATPGRHTQSGGLVPRGLPIPQHDPKQLSGRAEAFKIGYNFAHVISCQGACFFVGVTLPDASVIIEFTNALTGWDVTMEELLKTGERIANIRHAFNLREGINPLHLKNPDRIVGIPPNKVGPHAGITLDEETLDREFCIAMDWNVETAIPTKKKLVELGLNKVIEELGI